MTNPVFLSLPEIPSLEDLNGQIDKLERRKRSLTHKLHLKSLILNNLNIKINSLSNPIIKRSANSINQSCGEHKIARQDVQKLQFIADKLDTELTRLLSLRNQFYTM